MRMPALQSDGCVAVLSMDKRAGGRALHLVGAARCREVGGGWVREQEGNGEERVALSAQGWLQMPRSPAARRKGQTRARRVKEGQSVALLLQATEHVFLAGSTRFHQRSRVESKGKRDNGDVAADYKGSLGGESSGVRSEISRPRELAGAQCSAAGLQGSGGPEGSRKKKKWRWGLPSEVAHWA